jgi:hypothetical protein
MKRKSSCMNNKPAMTIRYAMVGGVVSLVLVLWYLIMTANILDQNTIAKHRQNLRLNRFDQIIRSPDDTVTEGTQRLVEVSADVNRRNIVGSSAVPQSEERFSVQQANTTTFFSVTAASPILSQPPTKKSAYRHRQHGTLQAATNATVRTMVVGLSQKGSDESFGIFIGSLRVSELYRINTYCCLLG